MKVWTRFNPSLAKLLLPVVLAVATPATFADPPTISGLDFDVREAFGELVIPLVVGDDKPLSQLLLTARSSNTQVIPDANLIPGGFGPIRDLRIKTVPAQFGTTQITATVTDSDEESTSKSFFVKVTPQLLSPGILTKAGGLGLLALAVEYNPSDPPLELPQSMGEFSGPFEVYSALSGPTFLSGTGNLYALANSVLINGSGGERRIDADMGAAMETVTENFFAEFRASLLRGYQDGIQLAPTPETPQIGPGLKGSFRPAGSYNDHQPYHANIGVTSVIFRAQRAWNYEPSSSAIPFANAPAIGLINQDSVSNAIVAGDAVPTRPVEPPPNTGTTFSSFDPAGISINSSYVAFYGKGDLFSGIYARRLSDRELFAAVESFPFQQGDLGFIWGAFLSGERDIFFNADAGIYRADAEGATPAELILATGTEYEPGKVFASGNLLHLAGNYGVIAGVDGNGMSTIFRLNLTDFSLEQIVQQGDAAPGGGTFSVVQRPAISDAMVVFEGFDDSFKFLGLFAYLIETQELKAIALVGDIIDGKEVRTLGSQPGALDGAVFGFTAYFTDNSSAAYLTTPAVSFSVPFLNISTRSGVGNGDDALIGGFIINEPPTARPTQAAAKQVLIRAIGPSLGAFGVEGPLSDTVLELHLPDGSVVTNDNWRDTQEQEILDTTIPPSDDLESAIVTTLESGAYTAIVRGKDGGTGVGLVEIYDLDGAAVSEQANISTRARVETGDNVLIGGIIVGGSANTASTMVVRAIGPSLTDFGVADALSDPLLELHDGFGALITANDNWKETQQAEIEAAQLAPSDDREAAIQIALGPGAYTAIVRGVGDASGVALVEAYNLEASGAPAAFPVGLTIRR